MSTDLEHPGTDRSHRHATYNAYCSFLGTASHEPGSLDEWCAQSAGEAPTLVPLRKPFRAGGCEPRHL